MNIAPKRKQMFHQISRRLLQSKVLLGLIISFAARIYHLLPEKSHREHQPWGIWILRHVNFDQVSIYNECGRECLGLRVRYHHPRETQMTDSSRGWVMFTFLNHARSFTLRHFQVLSNTFMHFKALSCTSMYFHALSTIVTNFHQLSSNHNRFQPLSSFIGKFFGTLFCYNLSWPLISHIWSACVSKI